MTPRTLTGLVLGATLVGGAASAAPFIGQFEAHNDMHGGALWRNDRPNNNNQRGAGNEHLALTQLTGGYLLVVGTASYTDVTPLIPGAGLSSLDAGLRAPADGDPGTQAQGTRVEGLCISYKLDATKGLVMNNMAYFTKNDSPDWQNMHRPDIVAVDGGKAAMVMYGYDENGNQTDLWAEALGPNCEILSKQTKLFEGGNDNYGGVKAVPTPFVEAAGKSRVCGGFIGNGNGTDDGWAFCATATATGGTGTAAYTLAPNFKTVTEPNEERTRPYVSATTFPNMMLQCWAAGNAQPPNRGLRCGMVNTAEGVADDQRLMWRQYVQERQDNIYYTTPGLAAARDASGALTDKFIVNYVMVNTNNRNGRAKGRTTILTVPIQITQTGFTKLDEPKSGLFGITDGAHPGLVEGVYGVDKRPVAFMFAGQITDGGTATAKIIGMTADNKLEPVRALNWASASSGGYTSQWYGHNPNTPQGRTYPPQAIIINNPGYGQASGYQPTVKAFLAVPNVYHNDHSVTGCTPDPNKGTNNGTCGGKNATGVSLIPVAADPDAQPNPNPDPNNPDPTDPTDPNGTTPDGGNTLGGCNAGGNGGFGFALLGLGLAVSIRRRRR
jgi:uncharacterized protein (TIGR03382 family)